MTNLSIFLSLIISICALLAQPLIAEEPLAEPQRPNIVWITGEDMSAKWLGCYGNKQISTPNFDKLAQEGFLYTNCFAAAPVCAPSRSSWITGIHPISSGTIYMRSQYALPKELPWYPDALRAAGYFTANYDKTDYNTANRRVGNGGGENEGSNGHYVDTWDVYQNYAWRSDKRKAKQPFFQVINSAGCHESYLHKANNTNNHVDPAAMELAAYHPDIPEMRLDYARYTAGVMAADKTLGKILAELEKDGLADNTIVIYSSDHGGVIGRSKRFLYDSGTRAPHIIRIPEKYKHLWPAANVGARIDRLVSFLDMPKTWLALVGGEIPTSMQGQIYLGPKQDPPRSYVFMARERMDEAPDMQRAVRDQRYLYIRSFEPFRPDGQYLQYLWQAPSMMAWDRYHRAGKTNALTGAFFRPKVAEMLFDCDADPDNVHNLASDPAHAERLSRMRAALREQQIAIHDCGFLPEATLLHRVEQHNTTIYELVRNPQLYDQQGYMTAADLANFAQPSDIPQLTEWLASPDEGFVYWAIIGCIRLGKDAAIPALTEAILKLAQSSIDDKRLSDVRVTAAYYLLSVEQHKAQALRSLAEIITAPGKSMAKGRAWANLFLLGDQALDIVDIFKPMRLDNNNAATLALLRSRCDPNYAPALQEKKDKSAGKGE
jgi:N-sulfoglucosamine sulfohydrolase